MRREHYDRRKVGDLEHGDTSLEYGPVSHREGRKVWFSDRIVTFTSLDDEVAVEPTDRLRA